MQAEATLLSSQKPILEIIHSQLNSLHMILKYTSASVGVYLM
jgi:hypothetical protein